MKPIEKDCKYIMDYMRFTPGDGWSWKSGFKRGFLDHLTFIPGGYTLASIEYELRDSLRTRLIRPAKRFMDRVADIKQGDWYGVLKDDIGF